jgi:hypothetical protein
VERGAPSSASTLWIHGARRFSWGQLHSFTAHLERNADGNSRAARVSIIIQVISVVVIGDVDIIGLVPVGSPEFRIRIHYTEPITAVLETREPANLHERKAVDSERMARAVVAAEIGVRNAIAVISAALLPGAMLGFEATGATLLPFASLCAFLRNLLLMRALLLNWLPGLPLVDSLAAVALLRGSGLLGAFVLLLLLGALLRVPVLLPLLDLLPVLILLLLRRVLLRRWFFLLLGALLRAWLCLLLLSALLRRCLFLLLLCVLLRVWPGLLLLSALLRRCLFLLLGMLLGGRPLFFLLAFLLRGLCLPVGLCLLLVAFLVLLRVSEHSRPKKYYKDRCPNNFKLTHRYFLVGSMNAWEEDCCSLLDIP